MFKFKFGFTRQAKKRAEAVPVYCDGIVNAAEALVRMAPDHYNLRELQFTLYVAQITYMGAYNKPLFPEEFAATVMGPQSAALHDKVRLVGRTKKIRTLNAEPMKDQTKLDMLSEIHGRIGVPGPSVAYGIVYRKDGPWSRYYGKKNNLIPLTDMRDEFDRITTRN